MKKQASKKSSRAYADALSVLAQDHEKVEKLFSRFEKLKEGRGHDDEKGDIVREACEALTVHARVEEEIFYPAVRKAIKDDDLMDEATVEHAGAKDLIAQLRSMRPGEDLFDAKFTVLIENVRHHIKEEEGEMFPKVKKSSLDLEKIGGEILARKEDLQLELGIFDEKGVELHMTPEHRLRS
jgi:hemerythrin superfamily protein